MANRCVLLGILLTIMANPAFAAEDEQNTDAVLRERYLSMAVRNPRRGTAVDKLYQLAAQGEGLDALVEKIKADSKSSANGWTLIGLLEEMRGREADALIAYRAAAEADAAAYYPRYCIGLLLLHRSDYGAAAESLRAAVAAEPPKDDAIEIRKALGRCYLRSRQMDEAREVWSSLAEMSPDDTIILQELTALLVDEEQWEDALEYYERLRKLQKDQPYQVVVTTIAMGGVEARRGDFEHAMKRYEEALFATKPDSWLADDIRQRIEDLFRRRNDLSGLVSYYEGRLAKDAKDVRSMVLLAQLLVELDRRDEARCMYEKALEVAPADQSVRLAMIRQLEAARDYTGAIRQYETLLEQNPKDIGYLEALGGLHLKAGDVKDGDKEIARSKAREAWTRIVDLNPEDPPTMVQVAEIFAAHAMNEEAERYFAKAVALAPDIGQYREYYGEFLVKIEQRDKALGVVKAMADGSRRNVQTLIRLADVLRHFQFKAEALAASREAVALAPDHFDARMKLVKLLADAEEHDEALSQLDEAARLAPNDLFAGQVVDERIRLLNIAGKLQEAYESRAEALESQSSDKAAPYIECSKMALQLSLTEPAVEYMEQALAKAPDAVGVLEYATRVFSRANDSEKLIAVLKRLIEIAPQNRAEYYQQLAQRYAQVGEHEEAIKSAEAAIAASPDNTSGYELLANLSERLGVADRSLSVLKEAVKVDPRNTELRMQYGRRLERSGEIDAAMEQFWIVFDAQEEAEQKLTTARTLAEIAYRWERFETVIDRLERQRRLSQDDWVPTLCMAEAYRQVEDFTKAREHLTTLAAQRPKDTTLLAQIVRLATAEGLREEALRNLKELAKLEPSKRNLNQLADLYFDLERKDEALVVWGQVAALAQDDADGLAEIAVSLLERGLNEEAAGLLARHHERDPAHWQIGYLYALALLKQERFEQADGVFVGLAALPDEPPAPTPKDKKPGANVSAASSRYPSYYASYPPELMRVQRISSIRYEIERATRGQPGTPSIFTPPDLETARLAAWHHHCDLARKQGKFDELVEALTASETPDACWRLVLIYSGDRDQTKLQEAVERLCKLAPNDAGAKLLRLQWLRRPDTKQIPLDEARKLYEDLIVSHPEMEPYVNSYWVYYLKASNQIDELKAYAQKIASTEYDDPMKMVSIVSSLGELGEFELAIAQLRRAEEKFPASFSGSQASMGPTYIYSRVAVLALQAKQNDTAVELFTRYLRITRPAAGRMSPSSSSYGYTGSSRGVSFPCPTFYYDESRLRMLQEFWNVASGKMDRRAVISGGALIRPPASAPAKDEPNKQGEEVTALLQKALRANLESKDDEDRIYARLGLSFLDFWNDKKDSAVEHLAEAVKLRPRDLPLALSLAQLRYSMGDRQGALRALGDLQRRYHPMFKQAQQLILRIAQDTDDTETAKATALRLFNMHLTTQEQMELAAVLHQLGLSKRAEQLEQRVKAVSSSDVSQLVQLMQTQSQRAAKKEAAELAKQILRNLGSGVMNEEYYRSAALRALKDSGDLKSMIEAAEKQRAENPQAVRVLTDLWNYYAADGDYDKASKAAEEALALRPEDTGLRYQYALGLYQKDQIDKAFEQLALVLDKDPVRVLGSGNIHQFIYSRSGGDNGARLAAAIGRLDWAKIASAAGSQSYQLSSTLVQVGERVSRDGNKEALAYLNKLNDFFANGPEEHYLGNVVRTRSECLMKMKQTDSAGAVTEWHLIGPFDNKDDKGLDTAYGPETDEFDPTRSYDGKTEPVKWRKTSLPDGIFNGRKVLDVTDVVLYGYTEVESPNDREATFLAGSDDGIKVWVNGKLVHTNHAHRALQADQDRFTARLVKGKNKLLVKVEQMDGEYGFVLRMVPPEQAQLEAARDFEALRYLVACGKGFEGFEPKPPAGMPAELAERPLGVKTRPADLLNQGGWLHPDGTLVSGVVPTFLDAAEKCGQLDLMRQHLEKKLGSNEQDTDSRIWLAMINTRLDRVDAVKADVRRIIDVMRQSTTTSNRSTGLGWLAQVIETKKDLIPLSVECNEVLFEQRQVTFGGGMEGLLYFRLAKSYLKADQRDKAHDFFLRIAALQPDPRYSGVGRDDYERQQNMLYAAQGLRDAGFLKAAYNIALKLSKETSSQNHGDYMVRQGRDIAERLVKDHPEIQLGLWAAAVPAGAEAIQIVWAMGLPEAFTGGRDTASMSVPTQAELFDRYKAEIQIAARLSGPFRLVSVADAAPQQYVHRGVKPNRLIWYRVLLRDADNKVAAVSQPVFAATGENLISDGDVEAQPAGPLSYDAVRLDPGWLPVDHQGKAQEGFAVIEQHRPFSTGTRCIRGDGKDTFIGSRSLAADPRKNYLIGAWLRVASGKGGLHRFALDAADQSITRFEYGEILQAPHWTCWQQQLSLAEDIKAPADPMPVIKPPATAGMPGGQQSMRVGIRVDGTMLCDDAFVIEYTAADDADLAAFSEATDVAADDASAQKLLAEVPPLIWKVRVADIGQAQAAIRWSTHEKAIATVTYRQASEDKAETVQGKPDETAHAILLEDLEPATTYAFTIQCCDAAGLCTESDEIEFKTISAEVPTEIVLDNESLNVTFTGDWATGSSSTDKYGSDYRFSANSPSGKTVAYSPTLTAGRYDVYAWWPAGPNRTSEAKYTVNHAEGSNVVTVDQKQDGGKWNLLGTFFFKEGSSGTVTITNDFLEGTIIADALKWVGVD